MLQELHCIGCRKNRTIDNFHKMKRSKRGYGSRCKDCANLYKREYRKKNPEKFQEYYNRERQRDLNYERYRDSYYKYSYGITLEEYDKLMILQNNKCAICLKSETIVDNRTKQVRRLSVDHNHETGKVRGLLCKNCNVGLGLFKENLNIIHNLIKYLENNNV